MGYSYAEDASDKTGLDASAVLMRGKAKMVSALKLPYIEKYRPKLLNDVVGNVETIERLKVIAERGNMPNLIIAGPPGTGKTTSISCLARELLGKSYNDAVLELNASDARGIDVVRNKIKTFAQKLVHLPPGVQKIIILDEADSMTQSAQQAMRRTMELYSSTTRFALACNTSARIIEAIQSRCAIIRYTRLQDKEVLQRLRYVCEKEGIQSDDDGLEALIFTAEGDMRNALNNLQSTYAGMGTVTADNVFKVVDQPHPVVVSSILEAAADGKLKDALEGTQELWKLGYSGIDIIQTFFRVCKRLNFHQGMKLEFVKLIGFTHMRMADGIDGLLQITGLVARLVKCSMNYKKA
jgi:replication factor C subunit 2/4